MRGQVSPCAAEFPSLVALMFALMLCAGNAIAMAPPNFKTPEAIRASAADGVKRGVSVDHGVRGDDGGASSADWTYEYGGSVGVDDGGGGDTWRWIVRAAAEEAMSAHMRNLATVVEGAEKSAEQRREDARRMAYSYCPTRSFVGGEMLLTSTAYGGCTSPACMMRSATALRDHVVANGAFSVAPGFGTWLARVADSTDTGLASDPDAVHYADYAGDVRIHAQLKRDSMSREALRVAPLMLGGGDDDDGGKSESFAVNIDAYYAATFMVRKNGMVCIRSERLLTHRATRA